MSGYQTIQQAKAEGRKKLQEQEAKKIAKEEELSRKRHEYEMKQKREKKESEERSRNSCRQYRERLREVNPSKTLFEMYRDLVEQIKLGDDKFEQIRKYFERHPDDTSYPLYYYEVYGFGCSHGTFNLIEKPECLKRIHDNDIISGCPYFGYTYDITNPNFEGYELVGYYKLRPSLLPYYSFRIELREKRVGLFTRMMNYFGF